MNLMPYEDYVRRVRPLLGGYLDGDTFGVVIDLGWHIQHTVWNRPSGSAREPRARLLGVSAPERYAVGGPAATAFTRTWLIEALLAAGDWPLVMRSEDLDAFGRFLAVIWRVSDGRCLNDDLIAAGHGVRDER